MDELYSKISSFVSQNEKQENEFQNYLTEVMVELGKINKMQRKEETTEKDLIKFSTQKIKEKINQEL